MLSQHIRHPRQMGLSNDWSPSFGKCSTGCHVFSLCSAKCRYTTIAGAKLCYTLVARNVERHGRKMDGLSGDGTAC
jgi:hypothetical protein